MVLFRCMVASCLPNTTTASQFWPTSFSQRGSAKFLNFLLAPLCKITRVSLGLFLFVSISCTWTCHFHWTVSDWAKLNKFLWRSDENLSLFLFQIHTKWSFYTWSYGQFENVKNETIVHRKTSLVAQMVKNLPEMQETWVWSLGWEDPL